MARRAGSPDVAARLPPAPSQAYPIPDLLIRPLPRLAGTGITRWVALRDTDPLLRRFGVAEVVRVTPERPASLRVRAIADEVWALLEGEVEFLWRDLRTDSPSGGRLYRHQARSPALVLAPFGVAFGFRLLGSPALLLRLATHSDEDTDAAGDQELPWPTEA